MPRDFSKFIDERKEWVGDVLSGKFMGFDDYDYNYNNYDYNDNNYDSDDV